MNSIIKRSSVIVNTPFSMLLCRAGQSYRVSNNRDRSGNADGILHDLPDFHYADGREAIETQTQLKWKRSRLMNEQILQEMKDEVKEEQSMVTERIDKMQEYINKKIKESKEKKAQKDKNFKVESTETKQ